MMTTTQQRRGIYPCLFLTLWQTMRSCRLGWSALCYSLGHIVMVARITCLQASNRRGDVWSHVQGQRPH
jgi:hypothetical protein